MNWTAHLTDTMTAAGKRLVWDGTSISMDKSIEIHLGDNSGMVSKTILLDDLRQTLIHILCKDLDEEEKLDMQSSIDDFMQNNATHCSPNELMADFDSTEKILDRFISHLETRKEMAGQTLH